MAVVKTNCALVRFRLVFRAATADHVAADPRLKSITEFTPLVVLLLPFQTTSTTTVGPRVNRCWWRVCGSCVASWMHTGAGTRSSRMIAVDTSRCFFDMRVYVIAWFFQLLGPPLVLCYRQLLEYFIPGAGRVIGVVAIVPVGVLFLHGKAASHAKCVLRSCSRLRLVNERPAPRRPLVSIVDEPYAVPVQPLIVNLVIPQRGTAK